MGLGGFEMPEWKAKALGKAPTFGVRDTRSIKEQRESLPVFEYRQQIIDAVHDNQVSFCYDGHLHHKRVCGACITLCK